MFTGDLTDLQRHVLKILAKLGCSWRLSGGGAIIGAYLHASQLVFSCSKIKPKSYC